MSGHDRDILARTIWGEMRGAGEIGMRAVACVVMNRLAKQSWYGHTIAEICLKESHDIYQFDCNDPGDPNFDKCSEVTAEDPQFTIAMKIAENAVAGKLADITRGALNYYSKTISLPSWAQGKTPCLEIGNTVFFNNIN